MLTYFVVILVMAYPYNYDSFGGHFDAFFCTIHKKLRLIPIMEVTFNFTPNFTPNLEAYVTLQSDRQWSMLNFLGTPKLYWIENRPQSVPQI